MDREGKQERRAKLREEYVAVAPLADRFASAVAEQLAELLASNDIALGVSMEVRVKKWESVCDKLERKHLELGSVRTLSDLVGIRLILLFARDVERACQLISGTFSVVEKENTIGRLGETEFGYQSNHLVVQLPHAWRDLPTFKALGEFRAEIQVRTLAQHIWAAASHKLQYKQESSVPASVRRTIHRVSALLETVDLEFERVLDEREAYVAQVDVASTNERLNVDLLSKYLDEVLPSANKHPDEDLSELFPDLARYGVETVPELEAVLTTHLTAVLEEDSEAVAELRAGNTSEHYHDDEDEERLRAGVYFTHVGLVRNALFREFGRKKSLESGNADDD